MRKSTLACLGVCVAAVAVAAGPGAVRSRLNKDLPPCVIKTDPADRETRVDPDLKEIKVTFDRAMATQESWSWIMLNQIGAYPGYDGSPKPRWENDGRTCVLSVRLQPDTLYAVGANSYRHTGFRDRDNRPAVPRAWVFRTRAKLGDRLPRRRARR